MGSWTNATTAPPPAVGILRPELQEALVRRDRFEPAHALRPWVDALLALPAMQEWLRDGAAESEVLAATEAVA